MFELYYYYAEKFVVVVDVDFVQANLVTERSEG